MRFPALVKLVVGIAHRFRLAATEHDLEVKIDKGVYIIIRPSGVSVPLPDPALGRRLHSVI